MLKDYEMSQQLFLDLWEEYGNAHEISEQESIFAFLNELIQRSKGMVILEQYLGFCFDCVRKVNKVNNLTQLVWQDFETFRRKQINGSLDEDDRFIWSLWDFLTDEYFVINISKMAFHRVCDHLFILLDSIPINKKDLKQSLTNGKGLGKCISRASMPYKKYAFSEGSDDDIKMHFAYTSNLPHFCCLLQPKEGAVASGFSSQLMYMATQVEIDRALSAYETNLANVAYDDTEELRMQGLHIRKMLESKLKYFCTYQNIRLHYDKKFENIDLSDLSQSIMKSSIYLAFDSRLIDMANTLLHDTDAIFTKEQLCTFLSDTKIAIDHIRRIPLLF